MGAAVAHAKRGEYFMLVPPADLGFIAAMWPTDTSSRGAGGGWTSDSTAHRLLTPRWASP